MSRLIQPRGLKYLCILRGYRMYCVEAYTASWIEIKIEEETTELSTVEAYTASWIEMVNSIKDAAAQNGRGLYSLVD